MACWGASLCSALLLLCCGSAGAQVSITEFGALPDSVTDNSAAIAKAIAAAQSRGQDVFVPAGQFAYGDLILLG